MSNLYHGSIVKGIATLKACSKANSNVNNGKLTKGVYLTSNYAYSLFYIWDNIKNNRNKKYITVYIKDGICYYEEQFSNQFYEFYNGVSGYVYCVNENLGLIKGKEESFYFSDEDISVTKCDYINDVYEKIIFIIG